MDHSYLLCHVCLMLPRLFIAALWSPAGKSADSWLLPVIFIIFCYFPMLYPGTGMYLIVSFHDRCILSYFVSLAKKRQKTTTTLPK